MSGAPDRIAAPEAGLTLVEMIVAMAIGAMVVAFLAQGTSLIRGFGRLGAIVSGQDETLAVRDHLRDTVAAALGGGTGPHSNGFAGIGDTAVFTVPGDRLFETGGPVRVTLAALPDGNRMTLAETRAPQGGSETVGRTRRLVTGAMRISFGYFGAGSGDAAAGWTGEWTDPGTSPALMRIDVSFPPGDGRRWPPFVVRMPSARLPSGAASASASATR